MARHETNRMFKQSDVRKSFKNKVKNGKIVAESNFRCHLTNENTVIRNIKSEMNVK